MNDLNHEVMLRLARARISFFPCMLEIKRPCFGMRFTTGSAINEAGANYFRRRYPNSRPAINCGGAGLVVIDLDRGHGDGADGVAEFDRLLDQHGELPEGVPAVRTPSNGVHLYFMQPPGIEPIGNSAGRIAPGIDVRGHHGFVVAPDSVNGDGELYQRIAGTPDLCESFSAKTIPPLPAWLAELAENPVRVIESVRVPCAPAFVDCNRRPYGLAILQGEADELAGVQSRRNQALNDSTFAISTKAGAHGLVSEAETWAAMWNACLINGWLAKDGPKAFRATFYSAWNAGLADPTPLRERFPAADPAFAEQIKHLNAHARAVIKQGS
jgi:hypothetical protein